MSYELTLYAAFATAAAAEMYFFLMQRVPLEIGHEHGIEVRIAREMLPTWYAVVWLAKIAKWAAIVMIWRAVGWLPVLLCFGIPFLLCAFIPVPYRHFANLLESNLRSRISVDPLLAAELLRALRASRDRHGY